MHARLSAFAGTLCLLAGSVAASAGTASGAFARMDYLQGSFHCLTSDKERYVETWTRPIPGTSLRATDTTSSGVGSEVTFAYDRASQMVYMLDTDRGARVDRMASPAGTDAFRSVTPGSSLGARLTRLSATSYRVNIDGATARGAVVHWNEACSK